MTNTWPLQYRITPIVCDKVVVFSQALPTKPSPSNLEKSTQTPESGDMIPLGGGDDDIMIEQPDNYDIL